MVRCADCGFISVRGVANGELLEADDEYRRFAKILTINPFGNEFRQKYTQFPICFAMIDLREELDKERHNGNDDKGCTLNVMHQDRNCGEFTKWRQGLNPKEHREMLDRQWMLKFQDDQRKEDRKWQVRQQINLAVIAGIFIILGAIIGAVLTVIH
jgi:hypothetical protein